MRSATSAASSAPENHRFRRQRRRNSLTQSRKVSESSWSFQSGASKGRFQAHKRFQEASAASAVLGTSSNSFLVFERMMFSQIVRSSAGRRRRAAVSACPENSHSLHISDSHADKGRIPGVGQEDRPAASCSWSYSCRSSRASRRFAVMTSHIRCVESSTIRCPRKRGGDVAEFLEYLSAESRCRKRCPFSISGASIGENCCLTTKGTKGTICVFVPFVAIPGKRTPRCPVPP